MINRWDSAAIVANTSELLPDPETPVNTVSRRLGISRSTSLRLFSRAPRTRMRSWVSAGCSTAWCLPHPGDDSDRVTSAGAGSSGGCAPDPAEDVVLAGTVIQAQDEHLEEREAAGDAGHHQARDVVEARRRHPAKSVDRYRDARRAPAELPDD